MLLFLLCLLAAVAAILVFGLPLLLCWALAQGAEEDAAVSLPVPSRMIFIDGRIWRAYQKWAGAKPARLEHRAAD